MKTVTVDNVIIGQGTPKIIVPIVEKDESSILKVAQEASQAKCDFVEWRIDHFEKVEEIGVVSALSKKVKETINKPLLITFRSFKEGGVLDISDDKYYEIYKDIIDNGTLDLLDVELYMPAEIVEKLVEACHDKGIFVVMCNHDFDKTPAKETIVQRLEAMEEKGGDICKIAVMPQTAQDVLTLLEATNERYQKAEVPLITMSMGALGMVSRLSGEVFGSAATFGALGQVSAPGQMPVDDLANALANLKLN